MTRESAGQGANEIAVVPLERQHWDRVRAIYVQGLAGGQASFETRAPDWPEWDQAHLPHSRFVAVRGRETVGWSALSSVSRRECYAGVAEVSIYVADEMRGRGVGRLLLETLVRESERAGIWTLQAGIFAENLASIRLHERCGFRVVGRRVRIARRDGLWRDTVLVERRSATVGT